MSGLRTCLLGACAPLSLMVWAGDAKAEQPTDPNQVLDPLVVTATRTSTPLSNVTESVSVVGASEIQGAPAKSLDEVLRSVPSLNLPGLASYEIFPNLSTVSLRGLGAGRALVLLDGVPLNDPFFGYVQWNLVPIGEVQRVEVVRGGGAPLWGNYAMGGVIDVITHAPRDQGLVIDAVGGSYGTVRANAYGTMNLTDRAQLTIDGGTTSTDGYIAVTPAFHVPLTVPSGFSAQNVQSTLQFQVDPTLSGDVRAGYHHTEQVLHTPANSNAQDEWNASGDVAKQIGESTLTATLFHTYSRLLSNNSDTPPGGVAGAVEFVQNYHITPATADGGSLLWSLAQQDWLRLLSVGVDFQQLHGTDEGHIFSAPGKPLRIDRAQGSQRFAGVFAQAEIAPLDRLTISASARYQYFENFGGFDGAPGGAGVVPSKSTSSFDPRISLKYQLTPVLALRAAGYQAFHAPTMNNLYRSFSNRFGIFFSNAALTPETLTGGEVGLDADFKNVRAQVTLYDSWVSNLLTTRPLAHAELPPGFIFGTRNINSGELHAQGVDSEVDWAITDRLAAKFAYAYADSIITSSGPDPASIGRQLGGVPRQTASTQLSYAGLSGWTITGRVFWHDRFFSDNDQKLPIGSQFVLDVGASYPVTKRIDTYVQIENLLDERHIVDNAGTSAPQLETPLTAMAGVRARF